MGSCGTVSLLTIMAYLEGGTFDLDKLFDNLEAYPIKDPPLKKNGSVDIEKVNQTQHQILKNTLKRNKLDNKKTKTFMKNLKVKSNGKINVNKVNDFLETLDDENIETVIEEFNDAIENAIPSNEIISLQYGSYIKGLESKKTKPTGEYDIYVNTKDGQKVYQDEYQNLNNYKNVDRIKRPGKKRSFPHQITLIYAYKPGVTINMFIFRQSIKIAGFKSQEPCEKMVKSLWTEHLVHVDDGVVMNEGMDFSFIFESAMTNTKFATDYKYKLTRVNTILNRLKELEGDNSKIMVSTYETTGDTGVTLKLKSDKPKDYSHNKWTWNGSCFEGSKCDSISTQRKTTDQKCTTVTFYDHKFLMSSRYSPTVEESSKYVKKILDKYADKINVIMNDDVEKFVPVFV